MPGPARRRAGGRRGRRAVPGVRRRRLRDRHDPVRRRRHVRLTKEKPDPWLPLSPPTPSRSPSTTRSSPSSASTSRRSRATPRSRSSTSTRSTSSSSSQIVEDEYDVQLKGDDSEDQDRRRRDRPRGARGAADEGRVVVTGVGAVTPLGVGARTLFDRWRGRRVRHPGRRRRRSRVRARPTTSPSRRLAARTASPSWPWSPPTRRCAEAGWKDELPYDPNRVATLIGTGIGGIDTLEANHKLMLEKGPKAVSPLSIPLLMGNAASAAVSMRHGLRGPVVRDAVGLCGRRARDRHGRADDPDRRRRRGRHRRLGGRHDAARHVGLRGARRARDLGISRPFDAAARRLRDGRGRRRARARGRRARARRAAPRSSAASPATARPARTRTT